LRKQRSQLVTIQRTLDYPELEAEAARLRGVAVRAETVDLARRWAKCEGLKLAGMTDGEVVDAVVDALVPQLLNGWLQRQTDAYFAEDE
jgi:hypothetical protein